MVIRPGQGRAAQGSGAAGGPAPCESGESSLPVSDVIPAMSCCSPSPHSENSRLAAEVYKDMPETSFTRTISNPEVVMKRRRQQKLERRMQEFRSSDGRPDSGTGPAPRPLIPDASAAV